MSPILHGSSRAALVAAPAQAGATRPPQRSLLGFILICSPYDHGDLLHTFLHCLGAEGCPECSQQRRRAVLQARWLNMWRHPQRHRGSWQMKRHDGRQRCWL